MRLAVAHLGGREREGGRGRRGLKAEADGEWCHLSLRADEVVAGRGVTPGVQRRGHDAGVVDAGEGVEDELGEGKESGEAGTAENGGSGLRDFMANEGRVVHCHFLAEGAEDRRLRLDNLGFRGEVGRVEEGWVGGVEGKDHVGV